MYYVVERLVLPLKLFNGLCCVSGQIRTKKIMWGLYIDWSRPVLVCPKGKAKEADLRLDHGIGRLIIQAYIGRTSGWVLSPVVAPRLICCTAYLIYACYGYLGRGCSLHGQAGREKISARHLLNALLRDPVSVCMSRRMSIGSKAGS